MSSNVPANWWVENRWVLTKRTLYAMDCVIILVIPFITAPWSYVAAIFVVISLAMFFRDLNTGLAAQLSRPDHDG